MTLGDLPVWYLRLLAICWGACWGSFANVAIYRWPNELSLVRPGSHCPHCGKPVRGYDNVPILAWLWLRGRCRDCKAPISPRYPLVEGIYALAAFALMERLWRGDPSQAMSVGFALFFARFAFAWGLLTAAFIDLETLLIPDFISISGAVIGIAVSAFLPGVGLRMSLLGAGLGFAIPFSLWFIWSRLLKREGMGLGDAKLLAMIGALLGPAGVLFSLSVGSMQGIVATVVSRVTGWRLGPEHAWDEDDEDEEDAHEGERDAAVEAAVEAKPDEAKTDDAKPDDVKTEEDEDPGLMRTRIPFGPFLALGALEYLLGADAWVAEYLRWVTGG